MGTVLFLVDDGSVGFWERIEKQTWEFYLNNSGLSFEKIPDVPRDVADRLRKLKEGAPELDALLITDQKLFGGEFDGADLAAQLIEDNVVKRAVVFSAIARLRPEQQRRDLIAESRIDNPKAIANIFKFLETGSYPETDNLLEYRKRIWRVLTFFSENVKKCDQELLKERLFRPAKSYRLLEGDPQDGKFLFDPWLVGLGGDMPELFSRDSIRLFDREVESEVIQYLGGENSEAAKAKWAHVYHCLHPWRSLKSACKSSFQGSDRGCGIFRLLMEMGRCGGRAGLVPSILLEEMGLSPRERAWVIECRKDLRARIEVMLNSSLSVNYCVQQCISELSEVCRILERAAATKDQK